MGRCALVTGRWVGGRASWLRWLLLFATAVLVLAPASCTSSPTAEQPTKRAPPSDASEGGTDGSVGLPVADIRELVRSAVSVGTYPGLSVWARRGAGSATVFAGEANLETGADVTARHRFRVASVTKSMVAALVLQLVEEGELSLSDSVQDWLPRTIPRGDEISIKNLLSHTSGLLEFSTTKGFEPLLETGRASARSVVALSAREGLAFKPGSGALYSNTDYVVLGLIVEKVTGSSLEENLRTRIFEPVGMASASLNVGRYSGAPMAHGYFKKRDVTTENYSYAAAAGDAVMSAQDVGRFFQALFAGEVVGSDLLRQMMRDHAGGIEPWTGYGYGLALAETACGTAYGHTGIQAGYVAEAWTNESLDRTVVALGNRAESPSSRAVLWPIVEAGLCE